MKKIMIYIDSMAPAGGIERVISNLSNEWKQKYEIIIVVKDKGEIFYTLDKDIKIIPLGLEFKLNMNSRISRIYSLLKSVILAHYKLKQVIKVEKPNCIYTSNPLNTLEIYLLGKNYMKKLIVSEHGSRAGYNRVYNYIKAITYPKAYKISVPTTLDTELYIKDGFPAIYIPHITTFNVKQANKLNNKIAINIGRLTSDKDQIALLKIWNNLYKNDGLHGWQLKIIGKGEEKENLQKFITENSLQNSVEIIQPRTDIEKIYQETSLFLFTSRYEGFGMVLLEAMSFGIPCIAFDCPSGPRDIITNEVNGYLIENRDYSTYEEKISILIKDVEVRSKMGAEAYEKVVKWENRDILDNWYKLFEEV